MCFGTAPQWLRVELSRSIRCNSRGLKGDFIYERLLMSMMPTAQKMTADILAGWHLRLPKMFHGLSKLSAERLLCHDAGSEAE